VFALLDIIFMNIYKCPNYFVTIPNGVSKVKIQKGEHAGSPRLSLCRRTFVIAWRIPQKKGYYQSGLRKINLERNLPSQNKFGTKIGPKQIDNDPFFRNAPPYRLE
jgi:hypothetical protein